MTHKQFKAIAERLLAQLPPDIREKLGNVLILVEDNPPSDRADWLGEFDGVSYGQGDPTLPNRIILYKNNLEDMCESEEEVEEEIRITLLHEIGHFLGLDEDELDDRGLG